MSRRGVLVTIITRLWWCAPWSTTTTTRWVFGGGLVGVVVVAREAEDVTSRGQYALRARARIEPCGLKTVANYLARRQKIPVTDTITPVETATFLNSLADVVDTYEAVAPENQRPLTLETPNLALLGGHRAKWRPRDSDTVEVAHNPHVELTDELCVTLHGHVLTGAALGGSVDDDDDEADSDSDSASASGTFAPCSDVDDSDAVDGKKEGTQKSKLTWWESAPGAVNFLPRGVAHTNAVGAGGAAEEMCLKFAPRSRATILGLPFDRSKAHSMPVATEDRSEPTKAVARLALERGAALATLDDVEGAVIRGDPKVRDADVRNRLSEVHLWKFHVQVPDFETLGYSRFLAKVTFFGPGASFREHVDKYDLLIVPLTGNLTVTSGPARVPLVLAPGAFAVVPEGTLHGFRVPDDAPPVEVLFVEIGSTKQQGTVLH